MDWSTYEEETVDLGECLGYTDDECPNCGRMRVELWGDGKRICEKCHWCIEDQRYYRFY